MKRLLESNLFLIAFAVIIICYLVSFISNDVVLSDKVYQKYLDEGDVSEGEDAGLLEEGEDDC